MAKELRSEYAVEVEVLPADLVDRDQLATVEARLADPSRPVDLLVNNAGFGLKGRFLVNDVDSEQAMLDVLVTAPMRLCHAALGAMTERGRGGIINVSSVAAFLPRGTYAAAKAWVNSFGEWAHNEYGPAGVTVTTLCPGFTKTEFHERMGVKRGHRLPLAGRRLPRPEGAVGLRQGPDVLDPRRAVPHHRRGHPRRAEWRAPAVPVPREEVGHRPAHGTGFRRACRALAGSVARLALPG